MAKEADYNMRLFSLSHRLEVRAQVAQAFLDKFQLSNEEMATLRGARDAAITEVISINIYSNELTHPKNPILSIHR